MKFLKKVQAEMTKVVWPSRNKTILYTIAVILVSLFIAYYMAGFDFIFLKYGVKSLIG
ncbi:MAG: preprotein translocase subunit SecE [Candidatus Pacebacteria bacterium]|nr:preprotein translocase subunit SecE [Candidatus Paceibacterota bacterium]